MNKLQVNQDIYPLLWAILFGSCDRNLIKTAIYMESQSNQIKLSSVHYGKQQHQQNELESFGIGFLNCLQQA